MILYYKNQQIKCIVILQNTGNYKTHDHCCFMEQQNHGFGVSSLSFVKLAK